MSRTAATPYPAPIPAWRVFLALFMRDVTVVRREMAVFLLRTSLQPLMLTLVFGYLLPKMGFVQQGYTAALLPGVIAISTVSGTMLTSRGMSGPARRARSPIAS